MFMLESKWLHSMCVNDNTDNQKKTAHTEHLHFLFLLKTVFITAINHSCSTGYIITRITTTYNQQTSLCLFTRWQPSCSSYVCFFWQSWNEHLFSNLTVSLLKQRQLWLACFSLFVWEEIHNLRVNKFLSLSRKMWSLWLQVCTIIFWKSFNEVSKKSGLSNYKINCRLFPWARILHVYMIPKDLRFCWQTLLLTGVVKFKV